jgi:hypothetical protein
MKLICGSIFLFAVVLGAGCTVESEEPGKNQLPIDDDACYSPTQNLDTAYDDGSEGCECEEGAAGQCVPDSDGRNVALVCEGGRWSAVEDGPCAPGP